MIQPDKLFKRLSKAYSKKSLRELATICGVSHELIRCILYRKSLTNISMSSFEKIEAGLRQNGF